MVAPSMAKALILAGEETRLWNPLQAAFVPTSDETESDAYEFEDSSDYGNSSSASNHQDDMNLSQLASINYDLLVKELKENPSEKSMTLI
ncbi:hypothetical protein PR202_ga13209 [Eleusine coracana subsp. coracana]|uniref:Uncharacterized protein n=1 Tax=Eleusine coracana subsp. coracana TaxID=191504 RepID=A0AAV5CEB6_ELECO|nr:hypothetical protein PR202_ga13209 [Eleusine coracana subsp. coracana]